MDTIDELDLIAKKEHSGVNHRCDVRLCSYACDVWLSYKLIIIFVMYSQEARGTPSRT